MCPFSRRCPECGAANRQANRLACVRHRFFRVKCLHVLQTLGAPVRSWCNEATRLQTYRSVYLFSRPNVPLRVLILICMPVWTHDCTLYRRPIHVNMRIPAYPAFSSWRLSVYPSMRPSVQSHMKASKHSYLSSLGVASKFGGV